MPSSAAESDSAEESWSTDFKEYRTFLTTSTELGRNSDGIIDGSKLYHLTSSNNLQAFQINELIYLCFLQF